MYPVAIHSNDPMLGSLTGRKSSQQSGRIVGNDNLPGTLTYTTKLPDGAPGIRQTVREIIRLARRDSRDPEVIAIARKLQVKGDDEETIRNLFTYVVRTVPYRDDTKMAVRAAMLAKNPEARDIAEDGTEFLVAPRLTLTRKWVGGDCDDLTGALGALALASGYRYWCRIIDWKPGEGFSHINGICEIPSLKWCIALDPVMKMDGWGKEQRPVIREEFFRM